MTFFSEYLERVSGSNCPLTKIIKMIPSNVHHSTSIGLIGVPPIKDGS